MFAGKKNLPIFTSEYTILMNTNWKSKPFVRVLLPFVLGLLWREFIPNSGLFIGVSLFSCILGLLLYAIYPFRRHIILGALLMLFFFTVGFFCMKWSTGEEHLNYFIHYCDPALDRAYIARILAVHKKENTTQYEIAVTGVRRDSGSIADLSGRALIYLKGEHNSFFPGDKVAFTTQWRHPAPPPNPRQFDFRKYLRYKNIESVGWVHTNNIELVYRDLFSWRYRSAKARRLCIRLLERYVPSPDALAISKALVLGDKSGIRPEVKTTFANTGAMHILAVSGLHVGIIFLLLRVLLGFFPQFPQYWQQLRGVLIVVGIWTFTFVTGMSTSTIRAATMFSLIATGLQFYRRSDIYNTLSLSALLTLFIEPYALFQTGFQLSYLATVGIVYFYPLFMSFFNHSGWLSRMILSSLLAGISARILSFPLVIYYFHQFSFAFLLSNFIVLPLAFVILILGWGTILIAWISSGISTQLGMILNGTAGLLLQLLHHINHFSYLRISPLCFSPVVLCLLMVSLGLLLLTISYRSKKIFYTLLLLLTGVHLVRHVEHTTLEHSPRLVFYAAKHPIVDLWLDGRLFSRREGYSGREEHYATEGLRAYFGATPIYLTTDSFLTIGERASLHFDWVMYGDQTIVWLKDRTLPVKQATILVIPSREMLEEVNLTEFPLLKNVIVYDYNNNSMPYDNYRLYDANLTFHRVTAKHAVTINLSSL